MFSRPVHLDLAPETVKRAYLGPLHYSNRFKGVTDKLTKVQKRQCQKLYDKIKKHEAKMLEEEDK